MEVTIGNGRCVVPFSGWRVFLFVHPLTILSKYDKITPHAGVVEQADTRDLKSYRVRLKKF